MKNLKYITENFIEYLASNKISQLEINYLFIIKLLSVFREVWHRAMRL